MLKKCSQCGKPFKVSEALEHKEDTCEECLKKIMSIEICTLCKEKITETVWFLNNDEPVNPVCEDCYLNKLY